VDEIAFPLSNSEKKTRIFESSGFVTIQVPYRVHRGPVTPSGLGGGALKDTLLVTYYRSDTVGWLELCVSQRGVRSVSFVPQTIEVAPSVSTVATLLIDELDRYFSGKTMKFSVPLDPATGTTFQRRVWDQLLLIPYGQTRSYAQIAAAVGNPAAARAVGLANGSNPIPILVPCHRVVRADGSLGGYSSGIEVKRALLALEGLKF
jgi:methylated-DNA-[protein]-cysteine S-methyltransferase